MLHRLLSYFPAFKVISTVSVQEAPVPMSKMTLQHCSTRSRAATALRRSSQAFFGMSRRSVSHVALTVFPKTQGVPLPPLNNSADGSHSGVDEQHAQGGIQQEVNEVSRRDRHMGVIEKSSQRLRTGSSFRCRMDSQRAGVLPREVGQVDVRKVDEQHPDGLFGGVQEPAGRTAGSLTHAVTLRRR